MKVTCVCGQIVAEGPGKLGLPGYGETVVCPDCGRDNSTPLSIVQRVRYFKRRLLKRRKAYGLTGFRLHKTYRGWRVWAPQPDEPPDIAWFVMWRKAPWYAMWHMGRKRDSVEKARAEWASKSTASPSS